MGTDLSSQRQMSDREGNLQQGRMASNEDDSWLLLI